MRKLFILIAISTTFFSCGKSGNAVPDVQVNFNISLADPRYSKLNTGGSAVYVAGQGVAGIIVYHDAFDGSYKAYDRCSSYLPANKCAVTIDDSGFTVTDPCSGSKFSLTDGSPVKAPATRSLKQYNAYISNFEIFVSN
jgi:nitrite reductase/ring-hydroxylating ferredoxin subunit